MNIQVIKSRRRTIGIEVHAETGFCQTEIR